jgi:fructose/tagatose bisphosphate aldolase
MSIVNAKEIMFPALKDGYAIGAFNITDLVQFEAVIDAAVEKKIVPAFFIILFFLPYRLC